MTSTSRNAGFALLLVLITLALVTSMAVLFLVGVGRERRGVNLYAQGSEVRHLTDASVNLVMAQINAATKEGSANVPISWASQPGMIRTYAQNGKLNNAYKLYSWDRMVESGTGGFDPNAASQLPPADWSTLPAQYVDLNQPVGNVYPIADPGAISLVEEFSVDQANAAVQSAPGAAGNKAPMPVKWLYVLQDGTRVSPVAGPDGKTVTVPGAAPGNPITGRIAFWTDDETSKVNINTASEGSFWDTPKAATKDEMQFAGNPPTAGEFQRISGHPATTCLSAVFPEMRTGSFSRWSSGGASANSTYLQQLQSICGLVPRINWGGSRAGTYPVASYNQTYAPATFTFTNDAIVPDADRLYASADDAWFSPNRTANSSFGAYGVDAQGLSRRLFFLTASSRAPETTLFETPRIGLWPITWPYDKSSFYVSGGTPRTSPKPTAAQAAMDATPANIETNPFMAPQERLLAFCSTVNSGSTTSGGVHPYYFQRRNPDSPKDDWTRIPRNQELVGYLRRMFDTAVPGMGSNRSLAAEWGSDNADWIALNCFDYSRSYVNQYTYNQTAGTNDYLYSYTGIQVKSGKLNNNPTARTWAEPNAYTVTPLHVSFQGKTYTTSGAYPALKEATVVFYARQRREPVEPGVAGDIPDSTKWSNLISWDGTSGKSQTTQMQAVILLSFAQMNPGVWSFRGQTYYSPVFWVKVSRAAGQGSFRVNGSDINLPLSGNGNAVQFSTFHPYQQWLSTMAASLYTLTGTPKTFSNQTQNDSTWSLVSDVIATNPDQTFFDFNGSKIQIDIYAPDPSGDLTRDPTGNPDLLVTSQQVDFSRWNRSMPIPLAPRWNVRQSTAVKMPSTALTTPAPAPGWQTELVPAIGQLTVTNPNGSTDPRTPSYTLTTTTSGEPLIYAYKDAAGTMISPNFSTRLKAIFDMDDFRAEQNSGSKLFGGTQPHTPIQSYQLITPYDTAISMVSDPTQPAAGDPRLMGRGLNTSAGDSGATQFIPIDQAVPAGKLPQHVIEYSASKYKHTTDRWQHHTFTPTAGVRLPTGYWLDYRFDTYSTAQRGMYTQTSPAGFLLGRDQGDAAIGVEANINQTINPDWDWTALPGNFADGGYIARPDQEYQILSSGGTVGMRVPYFNDAGIATTVGGNALSLNVFTPNRQIPSPIVLGTLPSDMNRGWQTLNFCPNPAAASNHPGLAGIAPTSPTNSVYTNLPDHLLLDLFWMPVVDPYPISDQFSTAGKVNLNYAVMPFSYIKRKTAMDAVLKSVWITALPSTSANFIKYHKSYGCLYNNARLDTTHTRYPINVAETLKSFDAKFQGGDIFRSASQVCDLYLYPNDPDTANTPVKSWNSSDSNIKSWWDTQKFTADNARESPYDAIYSRVTTKSNSFTVHWRVQSLRKRPGGDPATWSEKEDMIASELRGSTSIERYVDPNATTIPNYATDITAEPLSDFYNWRIVSENFFQP